MLRNWPLTGGSSRQRSPLSIAIQIDVRHHDVDVERERQSDAESGADPADQYVIDRFNTSINTETWRPLELLGRTVAGALV